MGLVIKKIQIFKLLIVLLFSSIFNLSYSDQQPNSTSIWSKSKYANVRIISSVENYGNEADILLGLEFKLKDNWKIYSKDSGDAGLPPLWIDKASKNLIISEWNYPTPVDFEYNDIKTKGYEDKVIFPWRMDIIDNTKPVKIDGIVEYYACNNKINLCVVQQAKLNLEIPANDLKLSNNLDKILLYQQDSDTNIFIIMLIAIISGLILNIMPCVLPIISIKLMVFRNTKNDADVKINSIFFSLGIITVFFIIALFLITLRFVGVGLGWGFQFQNPMFLLFMSFLLLIMGVNMLDVFEISNLGRISKYIPVGKKEITKSFFSGVVATLIATPCSAPLLSVSLGWAILLEWYLGLLIFIFMGIGMALPYLLFAIYPKIISYIPRSGRWNFRFKQLMGVLLIISGLFFAWVNKINFDDISNIIFVIIFLFIVLILRSKNNSILKILVLLLAVISMFAVASRPKPKIQTSQAYQISAPWVKFKKQDIKKHLSEGKTVIVDITANWCISCKINKITTFKNPDVIKKLSQKNIVAMRGDWTDRNNSILLYLNSYNRFSIPFIVVYSPQSSEVKILPSILKPNDIIKNLP